MEDLIVDCIGAFTMSIIGYISLKYKKGWIEKLLIKIKSYNFILILPHPYVICQQNLKIVRFNIMLLLCEYVMNMYCNI